MNDPDIELMKKALDLARQGEGLVSPNPMVGAVVVKDDQIVGEGFHLYSLVKHAEVHALEMAGEQARGATIYCSLEPCCNHGRTSPCTDAIIEAGIAKVVVATIDPNPRVNGRGLEILRNSGIEVEMGYGAEESRRLNEIYVKSVTTSRPFTHAVIASNINIDDWKPAEDFIQIASRYDSIVLSGSSNLDALIIDRLISRPRHRPLAIVATGDESFLNDNIRKSVDSGNILVLESNRDLNSIIDRLVRAGETSALILPSHNLIDGSGEIGQFDKITLLHSGENDLSTFVPYIIDSVARSSNITETTFYPRNTEQGESD
jgi:pyrimidine deaminase RibD-like protein